MELDVLYNGYPNVSYQSLGLDNDEQAMTATQYAEWCAAGNFSFNDIDWNPTNAGAAHIGSPESRQKVKAAVQKILQEAQNDPRQNAIPAGYVNYLGLDKKADGSVVTKISFSCTNGYSLIKPGIDLSHMPSDVEVTQNGQRLHQWSQVEPNKEIDVILKPGQKLTPQNSIGFHANCNQPAEATLYYQQEGHKQNALVYQGNMQGYVEGYRNFENTVVPSSSSSTSRTLTSSSISHSSSSTTHTVPKPPTLTTVDNITGRLGLQSTNPDTDTAVTDSASMTNLVKGKRYTLTFNETLNGHVITNDNGQPVTVSKTFTADKPNMTVSADLPKFDTTKYADKVLTIQSTLKDESGKVIATDNGDTHEQITISAPKMQTQALINGKQMANPNGGATIFDRVSFSGATPGEALNFKVIARDKAGKPIVDKINGKNYYLEGNVNYTPTGSKGIIDVPLEAVNAPADAQATTSTNANGGNDKWAKTTADEDVKNITIKPIQLGANIANPTAAAKQAGGSDLANPYAIDTDSLAGTTFGLSETMSNVHSTSTTTSTSSSSTSSTSSASSSSTGNVGTNTTGDIPIYHHGPSDSSQQTVSITSPTLHTEALIDDKHVDNPNQNAKLYDKVTYNNVVPGQPLELSALEYNKATGKPIVYDGNKFLAGRITFTPKDSSGSILVPIQAVNENVKDLNSLAVKSTSGNTAANNDDNAAAARISANGIKVLPVVMGDGIKTQASLAASQAVRSGKKASAVNDSATQAVAKVANTDDPAVKAAMTAALPTMQNSTASAANSTASSSKASSAASSSTQASSSAKTTASAKASSVKISGMRTTASSSMAASSANSSASATSAANSTSAAKAVTQQAKESTTNMSDAATNGALNNSNADTIDTTKLRGLQMVAVEDLSTPTGTSGQTTSQVIAQNTITSEADMNNKQQTIRVAAPSITTHATIDDKQIVDLDAQAAAGKHINYVDAINYEDFTPGEPVKFTAVAMDKATGKPVKLAGKYYLVGTVEITPKQANGTAKVTFHESTTAPMALYTGDSATSNATQRAQGSSVQISSVASSSATSSAKHNDAKVSSVAQRSAKNSSIKASSVAKESSVQASSAAVKDDTASVASADGQGVIQGDMNSYANASAQPASHQATDSSVASSTSSANSSSVSNVSSSATSSTKASDNDGINATDIPAGKHDWVAFETAQNAGTTNSGTNGNGGTVIAEDHKLDNKNETVTVETHHSASTKPTASSSSQKPSEQHQSQSQHQTASVKNQNGSQTQNQSQNETATNGANGANGQNGKQTAAQVAASPRFAQTSGTKAVSHNWLYNLIYSWFH